MKKKKRRERERENVENRWMMWLLIWLNRSVVIINATFQFIHSLKRDYHDNQNSYQTYSEYLGFILKFYCREKKTTCDEQLKNTIPTCVNPK